MQLTLRQSLVKFGHLSQASLFPRSEEEIGELGARDRLLVEILAMAPFAKLDIDNDLPSQAEVECGGEFCTRQV